MPTTQLAPVDIETIKNTAPAWATACIGRDWDALLGLCTDDVVFLPPDEPIVAGNQVRPWLENYPEIKTFEVTFDHVDGGDQLASAWGHFTMTLVLPGSSTPMAVDGKFLDSFRKGDDGTWRYAAVAWNSNVPSPLRGAATAPVTPGSALQATSLVPSLTVNDLAASTRFFEGLGMVVTEKWEEEGRLLGVMLGAGSAMIGLSQDDWSKGHDRVKGIGTRTWIETNQSVDELAARAKAAGVTLDKEPYDTPWKTRAFEVTTVEGFALTIATPATK